LTLWTNLYKELAMPSPESQRIRATFTNDSASVSTPIEVQRREWEAAAANAPLPAGIIIQPVVADGVPSEWVRSPAADADTVLLWLHGGGFSTGSCVTHRGLAAHLSLAAGIPVLTIDYRLVPEHPFPAGLADACTAYRWLLKTGYRPANIIIGGDSSGGGLAVSTLLKLREAGDLLPVAGVLMSPMLDMTLTGESFTSRAGVDPLISQTGLQAAVDLYRLDNDARHPLLSPVYADLRGLPPLLIQVGDHELLLSDSTRLTDRAASAGAEVALHIWPEMWHVFQGWAAELPEAQAALQEIGGFIRDRLRQSK
jgi:monoterpene epsilon-lactone hydrolase